MRERGALCGCCENTLLWDVETVIYMAVGVKWAGPYIALLTLRDGKPKIQSKIKTVFVAYLVVQKFTQVKRRTKFYSK